MREATEKEIRKRGLEVVFHEAFKIGSEDFYPILTRALATKPDAIDMVISIAPWSAGVINQSRELGFTGPIFATVMADTNILNSMLNPPLKDDLAKIGVRYEAGYLYPPQGPGVGVELNEEIIPSIITPGKNPTVIS